VLQAIEAWDEDADDTTGGAGDAAGDASGNGTAGNGTASVKNPSCRPGGGRLKIVNR
jgi:hypothetical protein